jgi:5-methylthioadenosine/S-adenosylhomocysteine deaminase
VTSKTLLGGGCVLTLGARTPNFTEADVLIEDGVVTEVGKGIRARDAERVDATDTIVMPGFVDTHRHTWTSLFRNLGAHPSDVGEHFQPDDVYAATLIGLLGAVEAGITTVVDWSDLPSDERLAEAALQAHADAGVRGVFLPVLRGRGQSDEGANIGRFLSHLRDRSGPSTGIALGAEVGGSTDLGSVGRAWRPARELGMRIHAHADPEGARPGEIVRSASLGLLGSDVTLVHHEALSDEDVDAIAASGTSVSMAPSSEMAGGFGTPPIQRLIDHGIRPGLGIGDERMAPGDLFAQMRATISVQHAIVFDRKLAGKAGLPRLMTTRDVIRSATSDGARAAGIGDATGSLEPGKRADVIVLRADRPNVFPINDPIGAVVWGMDTSNVDHVFVEGRVLMRGGVLTADVPRARELATAARRRVGDASGLVQSVPWGSAG